MAKRALAIGAHPDDIEFSMAGTLELLRQAGYEIHTMNIANGCCGTNTMDRRQIIAARRAEAMQAAAVIGATHHESLCDDIQILYEPSLLARVAAMVRAVEPAILLVPSPNDYMEDHQNASRLAVTAAFCRSMRNFATQPPVAPTQQDVTVYHAQPAGNRDPMTRQVVQPDLFVDVGGVLEIKKRMLACHRSQFDWLDASQGMPTPVDTMTAIGTELGAMSGRFTHAEGWRRRFHLGFSPSPRDPLADALGERCWIVVKY